MRTTTTPDLDVSAILPVFNEERHVAECLESLLLQRDCVFEVLVVDDGSTDRTLEIVGGIAARDSRVRVFRQDHAGPGSARNLGAREARGRILAFCDGDMVHAPRYLTALIAPIQRGEAVGTFSKEEYVANWDNIWARCWNINDGIPVDRRHPLSWPDRHEVFRAVRRDAFLAAGGFTPAGAGDDGSIARKIGELALAAPGAVCFHYNPDTLGEVFRSARWYARGRRLPWSWRNLLVRTPPLAIKRSLRRAIRHRMPAFVLFLLVGDSGALIGLIEKRLRLAGQGR